MVVALRVKRDPKTGLLQIQYGRQAIFGLTDEAAAMVIALLQKTLTEELEKR